VRGSLSLFAALGWPLSNKKEAELRRAAPPQLLRAARSTAEGIRAAAGGGGREGGALREPRELRER